MPRRVKMSHKSCGSTLIGSDEGGFIRLFSIYVEKFPIPAVPPEKQKAVVRLVDRILAAKQRTPGRTCALEREIDERGLSLYGLTPDEIKLVEESMAR